MTPHHSPNGASLFSCCRWLMHMIPQHGFDGSMADKSDTGVKTEPAMTMKRFATFDFWLCPEISQSLSAHVSSTPQVI